MYQEVNTKTNLPAQIEIYSTDSSQYDFLFIAKGMTENKLLVCCFCCRFVLDSCHTLSLDLDSLSHSYTWPGQYVIFLLYLTVCLIFILDFDSVSYSYTWLGQYVIFLYLLRQNVIFLYLLRQYVIFLYLSWTVCHILIIGLDSVSCCNTWPGSYVMADWLDGWLSRWLTIWMADCLDGWLFRWLTV